MSAQSRVDSLARLVAKAPVDTHRVSLLYNYAWEITESRPDEAETLFREAVSIAQRFGYKAGEANGWNGLGGVEEVRGNWPQALEYYKKTLTVRQAAGDLGAVAKAYSNLGKVYENLGDLDQAMLQQRENLRIREELRDTAGIALAHYRLAFVFQNMGFYLEAFDHVNKSRMVVEERHDTAGMIRAYTLMGHLRLEEDMPQESFRWYQMALKMKEHIGDSIEISDALVDMGNVLDELDTAKQGKALPYYKRALDIRIAQQDLSGMAEVYANLGDACKHLKMYDLGLEYLEKALEIYKNQQDKQGIIKSYNIYGDILHQKKRYREALRYVQEYFTMAREIGDEKYEQRGYKDLAKGYAALGEFKKAYENRVAYDEMRYKRLNETRARDFERKEVLFSEGQKQREIERQQHELARNRIVGLTLIGGAIALILLVGLLFNRNRIRLKANRDLASKNEQIERERSRADSLLKNILPDKTADELKLYDKVLPVRYESVSVLFTDFKSFTTISEQMTPEQLIGELDECFRIFDAIVGIFGLEKIKTIGDSYMCAGGLPTPNDTHPVDVVKAAIEMQHGLQLLMERKKAEGQPALFEMRIGIHTGPVVAGVVGSHKFAYDIWGDTVNTAARMEQGSQPHKINISAATYELVKHRFECTYRGKMAAKNKGEIDMYFVEYPDLPTTPSP